LARDAPDRPRRQPPGDARPRVLLAPARRGRVPAAAGGAFVRVVAALPPGPVRGLPALGRRRAHLGAAAPARGRGRRAAGAARRPPQDRERLRGWPAPAPGARGGRVPPGSSSGGSTTATRSRG